MKIIPGQIKKIKALQRALNLDDATYRDILQQFGVNSASFLDYRQAGDLINLLEEKAVAAGVWEKRPLNLKYQEYEGRPEYMAAPSKLRKIEALWKEVSYHTHAEARQQALYNFLNNKVNKGLLTALTDKEANKVIAILNRMKITKNQERRKA